MLATIGVPRHTAAQSTAAIPRVGYVFSFTPASGRHLWDACRQGLRDLGYVEGRTIHVEPRFAHDRRFKLYGDGRLFDVRADDLEERPIGPGRGGPEADAARRKLQQVLDSMRT